MPVKGLNPEATGKEEKLEAEEEEAGEAEETEEEKEAREVAEKKAGWRMGCPRCATNYTANYCDRCGKKFVGSKEAPRTPAK